MTFQSQTLRWMVKQAEGLSQCCSHINHSITLSRKTWPAWAEKAVETSHRSLKSFPPFGDSTLDGDTYQKGSTPFSTEWKPGVPRRTFYGQALRQEKKGWKKTSYQSNLYSRFEDSAYTYQKITSIFTQNSVFSSDARPVRAFCMLRVTLSFPACEFPQRYLSASQF